MIFDAGWATISGNQGTDYLQESLKVPKNMNASVPCSPDRAQDGGGTFKVVKATKRSHVHGYSS